MDDPRDDAIVTAVVGELAGIFRPLHNDLAQNTKDARGEVAELRDAVAELVSIVAGLTSRLDEIEEHAGFNFYLAKAKAAADGADETPPPQTVLPAPGTRRPTAVDRACAVDPAEGPQRVDLIKYGITLYPTPGADPATVWGNVLHAIDAERGAHGAARRPRSTRRI